MQRLPWRVSLALDLDRAFAWNVRVESGRCWSPETSIAADDEQATIPIWPSGVIEAKLVPPRGVALPSNALVTLDLGSSSHAASCTLREQRLTCPAPAVVADVRIEVAGFAPVYQWQRTIRADAPTPFGEFTLKQGASVAGRVAPPRRDASLSDVVVRIRPATNASSPAEAQRVASQTRTVHVDERGFFQFVDLEPGRYEVRAMKKDWSPSRAAIIDVEAGREAVLTRSLVLEPLVAFEIDVTPALAPDGNAWLVHLEEASATRTAEPIESAATPEGRWTKPGMEAGAYRLTVLDLRRNVFREEIIDVDPSTPVVNIRIDAVPVRGHVTFGGQPMIARVKFSRQTGKHAVLETNDEGVFSGVLPAEGEWDVEVVPKDKRRGVRSDPVEVRRPEGEDHAEVEIVLDGGRVSGRVVDETGKSVAGVVYLYRDQRFLSADTTAPDGTFEFVGVPKGDIEIRAAARDSDSGVVRHRVEGADDEPLQLMLRTSPHVRGWIVTRSGHAVAGAAIRYWTAATHSVRETITGPDGQFDFVVSSGDTSADVVVVAPPFAVKMLSLSVDAQSKEIVIDRTSGTLLIRAATNLGVYVRRGPVTAELLSLMAPRSYGPPPEWTARGYTFAVEPGPYLVCPAYAAPIDVCKAVMVTAGMEQEVDLRGGGGHAGDAS